MAQTAYYNWCHAILHHSLPCQATTYHTVLDLSESAYHATAYHTVAYHTIPHFPQNTIPCCTKPNHLTILHHTTTYQCQSLSNILQTVISVELSWVECTIQEGYWQKIGHCQTQLSLLPSSDELYARSQASGTETRLVWEAAVGKWGNLDSWSQNQALRWTQVETLQSHCCVFSTRNFKSFSRVFLSLLLVFDNYWYLLRCLAIHELNFRW